MILVGFFSVQQEPKRNNHALRLTGPRIVPWFKTHLGRKSCWWNNTKGLHHEHLQLNNFSVGQHSFSHLTHPWLSSCLACMWQKKLKIPDRERTRHRVILRVRRSNKPAFWLRHLSFLWAFPLTFSKKLQWSGLDICILACAARLGQIKRRFLVGRDRDLEIKWW